MHTARSITADQTVEVLHALVAVRGAPTHIRCDNGSEMTAHTLIDWCVAQSTLTSLRGGPVARRAGCFAGRLPLRRELPPQNTQLLS